MPNRVEIKNTQKYKLLEGGRAFLDTLEMRLFGNDVTPSGTVMPTLSDELDDTGYLADAPVANPFPTTADTLGTRGRTPVVPTTFVLAADGAMPTIYGVFFTDPADSDVTVMAQRMDVPFPISAAGQVFNISGNFLDDTLTP